MTSSRLVYAQANQDAIEQPEQASPNAFIERAFAMRDKAIKSGDQAYGAIIVQNNRIISQTPSRVIVRQDPSAHAEMEAIRAAAQALGTRDLSGCVMYSSSPPCPMCRAATYWANLERLYFGASITDGGSPSLC